MLDSNVLVAPGTLARSVDALVGPLHPSSTSLSRATKRRIGLVHHVPFAFASEHTSGSQIEEAFLNTNHAKMYIGINAMAVDSCVVGKSNMYRRSDLERVNGDLKPLNDDQHAQGTTGLAAFGRFLAEDNMIASALWHELGLRHDLSCDTASNAVGNMTFSTYVWRRVRWIRVRKHMVMAATLIEPLTECVILSVLAAWALKRLFGVPPWLVLALHYPTWIALDLDVYESLAGHPMPASRRWKFLGAWILRESLALPIWFLAMVGDQVEWRGRTYQVLRNGEVRRANSGNGWLQRLWIRKDRGDYEQLDQVSS